MFVLAAAAVFLLPRRKGRNCVISLYYLPPSCQQQLGTDFFSSYLRRFHNLQGAGKVFLAILKMQQRQDFRLQNELELCGIIAQEVEGFRSPMWVQMKGNVAEMV